MWLRHLGTVVLCFVHARGLHAACLRPGPLQLRRVRTHAFRLCAVHECVRASMTPTPNRPQPRRSSLSVRDGRSLAERMLRLRAECDNVWAVITLDGCYLEQVGGLPN